MMLLHPVLFGCSHQEYRSVAPPPNPMESVRTALGRVVHAFLGRESVSVRRPPHPRPTRVAPPANLAMLSALLKHNSRGCHGSVLDVQRPADADADADVDTDQISKTAYQVIGSVLCTSCCNVQRVPTVLCSPLLKPLCSRI